MGNFKLSSAHEGAEDLYISGYGEKCTVSRRTDRGGCADGGFGSPVSGGLWRVFGFALSDEGTGRRRRYRSKI